MSDLEPFDVRFSGCFLTIQDSWKGRSQGQEWPGDTTGPIFDDLQSVMKKPSGHVKEAGSEFYHVKVSAAITYNCSGIWLSDKVSNPSLLLPC